MTIRNPFKPFILSLLPIAIICTAVILNASSSIIQKPSPAEHKKIIEQYINEIKEAEDQSVNIAQAAVKSPSSDNNVLFDQINKIGNNLANLNERMENYANVVQGLNEQDRQIRLTFNYLNLVRSNLSTLKSLVRARSNLERISLLDEYFGTRINASNTLTLLKDLLEQYNA